MPSSYNGAMNWKTIEGFERYEISDEGQVRNIETGRVLKTYLDRGRAKVGVMWNGKQYAREVAKLMAGKVSLPKALPQPIGPIAPDDGTTWKPIVGFEAYEVNELGKIRNARTFRLMRIFENNGFNSVILRRDGKSISVMVQYAVAQTFIPGFNRETHFVRHKDEGRKNNQLDNLSVRERGVTIAAAIDPKEFAKRKAEAERKRLAGFLATIEARRAVKIAAAQERVAAYNEAIAAAAAERKKAKPKPRLGRDKTRNEIEADLTGWIEKLNEEWHATIKINGEPRWLGMFKSLGEAMRVTSEATL
jgi:hypothetical protein